MRPDSFPEKTLRRPVLLAGVGVHTGRAVSVRVEPAPAGTGIRFRRSDAGGGAFVRAAAGASAGERRSRVGTGASAVETVEHLLAAASGLGLANLFVTIEGPEVPILDGSALGFVRAFLRAGLKAQGAEREVWRVPEPLFIADGGAALAVLPDDAFRVTYTLDYAHPALRGQTVSFDVTEKTFVKDIAPARTFCTEEEALVLRRRGLGRGADTRNTLVMTPRGPKENRLRFRDECARHKVLDLVGDLALLGFAVRGHVVAIRSGHALNHRLLRLILNQKRASS
jgi:UDP-3-O-acyl N-acetylglucosamine deacetylase